MQAKQARNLLAKADSLLEQISVKGDDVFRFAQARQAMKAAFDALNPEPEHEYRTEGNT